MARWSFTTKVNGAGNTIDASHINDLQTAIVAIEPYNNFTAPPTSSWSWLTTQGSASVAQNSDGEILLTVPGVSGDNIRMYGRSLVASSNYTVTMYLDPTYPAQDSIFAGMAVRESSSGKIVTWGPGNASSVVHIATIKWTNATTYSADYSRIVTNRYHLTPKWYRVRDDATNRYYEWSHNGTTWQTHTSALRTDFLTPDQVGICINHNNGSGTAYLNMRSYAEV